MSKERTYLFSSESVNEGHPDKLADIVSDAVLDACLAADPESKVACESCCKTGMVMVFGEITTKGQIDYEKVVRNAIKGIGYDAAEKGMDYKTANIIVALEEQSPDIAQGVHVGRSVEEIGAGDQGLMFGYASDETEECMPMTHLLATKLGARLTEVRKNNIVPWVRPDGKIQVTMEIKEIDGRIVPQRVHTVLISTQHEDGVSQEKIKEDLMKHVIEPVIPAKYMDANTKYVLNPSGRFVIGGPHGDAGLTGRKIIVDTYGGWGAHGGGAFSGKDPSKVDRSAAYYARWIAKSLVKSGVCSRCLVQIAYGIGVSAPISVHVETYGTAKIPEEKVIELVHKNFDMRAGCLVRELNLKRPIYSKTCCYGHFGRSDPDFTWETPKKIEWQ